MVRSFIKNILHASSGADGLFGRTTAYYETVESQGHLTLHLHLLLWIASCLSLQEIRDQLLADDVFCMQLIQWLESSHTGDFSIGSMDDIADRIDCGEVVHSDTSREDNEPHVISPEYTLPACDPTTCLPILPPVFSNESAASEWYSFFCTETDNIVYSSNRHSPSHNKGCRHGRDGYCHARFPQDTFSETVVDPEMGALQFKKTEPWINTYNQVLSYVMHCNTDVTCLLSGTQVRTVIAYVTDYVMKYSLTTHTIFETVKSV
ncbi:hypothetical protein BKA93DRAFT_733064, partial [Sparassis latifolia]